MNKRAPVLSMVAAASVALAGPPASAEVLADWPCKGCDYIE